MLPNPVLRMVLICGLLQMQPQNVFGDELLIKNGVAGAGANLMIGDKKQWDTVVGVDPVTSASGYLSVERDASAGTLNVNWNGNGEAQFFIAYKSVRDHSELLSQDAALVLLMQVGSPPKKKVQIRMGCGYPCMASANIDNLLQALPVQQWLRVSFDLQCFADGGLDITKVDAPLILSTAGNMAILISDVTIVPGAGPEATVRCR